MDVPVPPKTKAGTTDEKIRNVSEKQIKKKKKRKFEYDFSLFLMILKTEGNLGEHFHYVPLKTKLSGHVFQAAMQPERGTDNVGKIRAVNGKFRVGDAPPGPQTTNPATAQRSKLSSSCKGVFMLPLHTIIQTAITNNNNIRIDVKQHNHERLSPSCSEVFTDFTFPSPPSNSQSVSVCSNRSSL